MFTEMMMGASGGGTPNFSIDEHNCYSSYFTIDNTENAIIVVGTQGLNNQEGSQFVGIIQNGVFNIAYNVSSRYQASYDTSTHKFQVRAASGAQETRSYVKAMWL